MKNGKSADACLVHVSSSMSGICSVWYGQGSGKMLRDWLRLHLEDSRKRRTDRVGVGTVALPWPDPSLQLTIATAALHCSAIQSMYCETDVLSFASSFLFYELGA